MAPVNHSAQEILIKLDAFIRKYYKNRLIRGAIYFGTGALSFFLLVSLLEYFGQFNTTVRTILFYSFIVFCLSIAWRFVFIPLAGLYRIGKVLSYEEAASIIGSHFGEVRDKLLNVLQLQQASAYSPDNQLLLAGISQKTLELRPVPFSGAINLRENLRYLRFILVPFIIILGILILAPRILTDSGIRLLQHQTYFEPKAPFQYEFLNGTMQADQGTDFELQLKVSGEKLPDAVFVVYNGTKYRIDKQSKTGYSYIFRNLQKDLEFQLEASGFLSKPYKIKVIPRASVIQMKILLEYPAYLNRAAEKLNNVGDLNIPAGTKVSWKLETRNAESVNILIGDKSSPAGAEKNGIFSFPQRFLQSTSYKVKALNSFGVSPDSVEHKIQVIADAYPSIMVNEMRDSASRKNLYFIGSIEDDHGFRYLSFRYRFKRSSDEVKLKSGYKSVNIGIEPGVPLQKYYHYFNLEEIGVAPEDELEYYFEIIDNDAVTGPKSSRTGVMSYQAPSKEEIRNDAQKAGKAMQASIEQTRKELDKIDKSLKELELKMLEKSSLQWEDRKQLEQLLKQQEELQKQMKELVEEQKQNFKKENEFMQPDQELLEKQKELEKLFEELLSDEQKDQLKKLEEMIQQNQKDKIREELHKMQLDDKEVKKQLDRMLEQYKELEVEKKLEQSIDKLEELQKKQEELSEKSKNSKENSEKLLEEQKKLNEEFKQLEEDLKELEEKNEELEDPYKLEDTKQEQDDIKKDQQEGTQNLQDKKNQKASEKQKSAAKRMDSLKSKLNSMQQQMKEEKQAEDYMTLRTILENLIQLSKDQEALMEKFKTVSGYNPQFVSLSQEQRKLQDDARLIEDSLAALSKRLTQISAFVNREVGKVNDNMQLTVEELSQRNVYSARVRQQYAVTSLNNLAVLLSDVLKSMQEDMSQSPKSGKGNDKKSGKGKGGEGKQKSGFQNLKQMQDQLGKQLDEMQKGGQQQGKMTEQMAKAAAQQMAIRNYLQQLQKQLDKEKTGNGSLSKEIKETEKLMEQMQKDLVNQQINPETIRRHKEITTRLLEHEKAQREQEQDNKRESNEGKEQQRSTPPALEEYLKQKNREVELLRTVPPGLQPYYQEKVKNYFRQTE